MAPAPETPLGRRGARLALWGLLLGAVRGHPVRCEDLSPPPAAPQEKTARQLTKDVLNPFAQIIKVPVESVTGFRIGPDRKTGESVNIEPVVPFSLGAEWNLIVQPLLAAEYLPNPNATAGLQDMQTSVFLTPAMTTRWIWGVGPIVQVPTATSKALGSGKWSAGPTGAVVYDEGPWLNGVLASHLASFGGDPHRASVSLTSIEPQVSYTFESGWYIQCSPTITYDWSGQAWTLPLGTDVGKTFTIGSQSMSLQIGAYGLVRRPEGDPASIVRVQWTLLFPTRKR